MPTIFSLANSVGGVWPIFFWGVIIIAAIGCAIGFHEFVWFISVGYGFAVMGIGLYNLVLSLVNYFTETTTVAPIGTSIACVLLMVYGYRLGSYILRRELTNVNYKKKLESTGSAKKMPIVASLITWLMVVFLYTAQTSAITYRLLNQTADNFGLWCGILIMAIAIVGESVADAQKSAAKKVNARRFCDKGLYRICRCPNYFCEILFWVGVTVSGIGSVTGWQWAVVLTGFVLIAYVMMDSAKRLEIRHEKTYGLDPAYQAYSDKVPLLFPLIGYKHAIKTYRD